MKIEEIKKRYKDEWVLVEVLAEDKLREPVEVELIAHSKSRDDTYEERAPLINLKSISVLGKGVDNVQTIVHNLPEKSYVDGLLGLSFLRRFKVCLDFQEGILEIE